MNPSAVSNDGRADLVRVTPPTWEDVRHLRGAERICADLGSVRLLPTVRATAAQVSESQLADVVAALHPRGLLSVVSPVRLVVRLEFEDRFSRSALREAVARRFRSPITRGHERANEVWLVQDSRRSLRVGLRINALEPERAPRPVERRGSLRPSVAAAMIGLAGQGPGRLLDPCCGSGTVLAEATHASWLAVGGDHAMEAVVATRSNTSCDVVRLDARRMPFADDEFDLVVSNLPFGHQYEVQGVPVAWYRRTLSEALRVAPRAVVLAPANATIPPSAGSDEGHARRATRHRAARPAFDHLGHREARGMNERAPRDAALPLPWRLRSRRCRR